jgi:ABC-type nitrate/sulfonate/bicarbonate transport system substrate-binding protein
MDEQNSIHFLAGHFIPQFLTKPIDWEVKKFASSGQGRVSALARGAIDGITTSWTYLVQIAFNQLPGTCLAGMAGGGSRLLVPANSPIKSYADLKGKKVGVVEFSFQDILFIYAAKAKGIDAFKDIQRVNAGSPAGVVAAMTTGQVDACAIWEPYASILMLDKGAKMISNLGDDSFGISNGGIYVHNDFIKNHPDLTQDVINALVKATDFIVKNKQKWIERTMKVTGQSEAVAKMAVDNCTPSVNIPIKTIQQISKAMYELGIQNRDVTADLPKYIDYSFLEKATGKSKNDLGFSA